jgi:ABC-type glycerol-3-phosphate transport system permease component
MDVATAAAEPRAGRGTAMAVALAAKVGNALVLLVIAGTFLFPVLWGVSTSFKPADRILANPPEILPATPTLAHYERIISGGILFNAMNSGLVAAATVTLCLAVGLLAAYALARHEFRGKRILLVAIVGIMCIPLDTLLIPTFTYLASLGLLNTRTGLVLLYTAYQLPLAVWILYGYILTLPRELEHAAMVDGYSEVSVLRKIVLPLTGSALVAAGLFILSFAWNDFVVALIMTSSESVRTLPIAVYQFLGYYGREWGPLTAASTLAILPVIVLFVFFQRYFLAGVTSGSIKG